MARTTQSSGGRKPAAQRDEDQPTVRTPRIEAFWSGVEIDVVELDLPTGVGYTLRAYRMDDEITPTVVERDDDDPWAKRGVTPDLEDEDAEEFDEDELTRQALAGVDDSEESEQDNEAADDDADDEGEEDEEQEQAKQEAEEVPLFLSHKGKLLLFRSAKGLVDFIKSDAPHDLVQLSTWKTVRAKLRPTDIVAAADDTYEFDLVVDNLRGPVDGWDRPLLIKAGEAARDLAFALRLDSVTEMLAAGSPLDDLDEAVRAAESGGISGFMAQRKLRKIGVQTASLGWRTIIGKISGVVDWRD